MQRLTKQQNAVFIFVREYIAENTVSPTYAEIQAHFGFSSVNAVSKHIKALIEKKYVEITKGRSRSISLVEVSPVRSLDGTEELPWIGRISAGLPIEIFPSAKTFAVSASMVRKVDRTYVLEVVGDNLQDELMANGDFILVEVCYEPNSGDTVVALINRQDIIISRYYDEGEYIKLVDSNPNHNPMIFRKEDIEIQGVVVSLLRFYTPHVG